MFKSSPSLPLRVLHFMQTQLLLQARVACDFLTRLTPEDIEHKGGSIYNVASVADRTVGRNLSLAIQERFPGHRVFEEESLGADARHMGEESQYHWHVDPIDGTYHFNQNFGLAEESAPADPFWGMMMACVRAEGDALHPVASAILYPHFHQMVFAAAGHGAWRQQVVRETGGAFFFSGGAERLVVRPPAWPLVQLGGIYLTDGTETERSYLHSDGRCFISRLPAGLAAIEAMDRAGISLETPRGPSSVSILNLLQGDISIYAHESLGPGWHDAMPALCLISEAGGCVELRRASDEAYIRALYAADDEALNLAKCLLPSSYLEGRLLGAHAEVASDQRLSRLR